MRIFKSILSFILVLVSFFAKSDVPDSLINIVGFKKLHPGFIFNPGKRVIRETSFAPKWLLINDDKQELKFGNRNDINYTVVYGNSGHVIDSSRLEEIQEDKGIFDTKFNGIAWYKCYFKVPTKLINQVFELEFTLHGALEIYIDGELQASEGVISSNPKMAEELNIKNGTIYFPIHDTSVHCISIRYGLINFKDYLNKYEGIIKEPYFEFSQPEQIDDESIISSVIYSITNMLSAFFFALFIIHLLIYLFYREQSFNLLYSLFLILLSLTFLESYLVNFIKDLDFYLWLDKIDDVILPTVCIILVTILNKLLNEKRSWHYVIICALLVYLYIDVIFIRKYYINSVTTIVFYTYFNTLAHSIKGIRRKVASAKFLGWGILSCTISFILLVVVTFFISLINPKANDEFWILLVISALIIISILSIPISMSAYLAFDFANTNRALSKKLVEVEDLSIKNMEQEKEKQKILAEQNEKLEVQVIERTKEINEQKKVIEEKNKDITDSINYAQRIQRSILPTETEIKGIFENAFVLFKPRDIVSGDFYQFKKVGDYKFAILADCTGHGVPGALMSMIGSNLLKQIIVERKILEPNLILSELHKEVKSTLRQTSGGAPSHDGMDASVVLLKGKKIYIASANRPVFVMQDGELTEIKPDKKSIGGSQSSDDIEFTVNQIAVQKDTMLYLFSDGYADQFGGETGKKFKVKNLSALLLSIHAKPLDVQHEILNSTFDMWKNHLEQVDDVSLIGIRF